MLDFITVVFQDELPLLEIQARSLDLYVLPADISQIIVIVNDTVSTVDTAWWGQHQDKVIVKPGQQFNVSGWESQQLLKLLATAESITEWAMVLDAKTWFITEFDTEKLYGKNKKPWTGSVIGLPGVFVEGRTFVENYYNIKMPKIIGPNGVPYLFHVATVKDMIAEFDNFTEFFLVNVKSPNFITEFFLYSGYVIKRYGSIEELYNTTHTYLYPMNIDDSEVKNFDNIFKKIKTFPGAVLTASIHRRAYQQLTPAQLKTWLDFLINRQLFCNIKEGSKQLNTYIN
jgi:hypothetical protein